MNSGLTPIPNLTTISGTLAVAKGGTGLTSLGSALQVLRVNSGGTALEYGTVSGGGTPGGSSGQVQWNNGGSFAGLAATAVATSGTHLRISAAAATDTPLALRSNFGQTANILTVENAVGTQIGGFSADGYLNARRLQGSNLSGLYWYHRADAADLMTLAGSGGDICELNSSHGWIFVSDVPVTWASGSSIAIPDTGLGRAAAGVVQIKDGGKTSSGYGHLRCGQIQTNTTSAGTTLGSVAAKLPVYNQSGTLVGYAPLYDSIT